MAPFDRPTLEDLVARTEAEIASRLQLGPLIERGPLRVLARVFAGAAHSLYGYLDFIARQTVPLEAEGQALEQWASLYGLERLPATRAQGPATFSGTNGSTVPSGALVSGPSGQRYRTTASGVVSGGSVTVDVQAELAGVAGNAAAGTVLALAAPIAGVSGAVVAAGAVVGGEDRETDAQLRTRLRDTVAARPQGGSLADYKAWALEVPGVTRVFVFGAADFQGPGTVGVTFAADDDPAGPVPPPALVADVLARITDPTRRDSAPVTAAVTVFAAVETPVDLTIELVPDTADVRAAVEANLRDLILRDAIPGGTLLLSRVREAISTASGEEDSIVTVPAANLTFAIGELPVLGTITWV